jgi:peptidase E
VSATRRILATSGGFVAGATQRTIRPGQMLLDALALTGKVRPRVCLVLTASGDDAAYYAMTYEALNAVGCDVTEMKLFVQPSGDPHERLGGSDLVWVGGAPSPTCWPCGRCTGSTRPPRAAYESGVIMAGVSAGSSAGM